MAYPCPRCGGPVKRGSSAAAGIAGGAAGALLMAAFGSFQCKQCGSIPRGEFAPEIRQKMTLGTLALVACAAVLIVGVVFLLVIIQRR